VRHLIRAGVPPHTVMAMSGHRTASMPYDIISLDDLQAAHRGSEMVDQPGRVTPLKPGQAVESGPVVELWAC